VFWLYFHVTPYNTGIL